MASDKKIRWADIEDDEELELAIPVVISKHGIKVKKSYVPPHLRTDKSSKPIEDKKNAS
jgi:hypothetical protein